jgi:hypothetical protein
MYNKLNTYLLLEKIVLRNTILVLILSVFIVACGEPRVPSVEENIWLEKEANKLRAKEANELNISSIEELMELKAKAKELGVDIKELEDYKKIEAKNLNVPPEELRILKNESKNLGLTVYQYKDKLEKEKKDAMLLEALAKLNTKGNNMSNYSQDYKAQLKEEYKNKIRPEYNFVSTTIKNPDSFALVIGINQYKQNTQVEFADLSALAFEELAINTLGIPKENVITLLNDDATSGQLKAKIELVKELADSNGNLYVYFAGHGVPGKDGNTYILPNDMSADSIHLEPNLELNNIYSKLAKSNAKNVFVFMDSCFSGKDDEGELLYKGVAPILKRNTENSIDNKLTVLTAGGANDFANDYNEKKQRLFSYYLIQELASGKTDLNEIYSSIKNNIKRTSLMKGIGYKQVPEISGNYFNLN